MFVGYDVMWGCGDEVGEGEGVGYVLFFRLVCLLVGVGCWKLYLCWGVGFGI